MPASPVHAALARFAVIVGLVAGCALLDLSMKAALVTPAYAEHPVSLVRAVGALIMGVMLLRLAATRLTAIAPAVGGIMANGLDMLDGRGRNPFVLVAGDRWYAFNLADLFIVTGAVTAAAFVACDAARLRVHGRSASADPGASRLG